MNNIILKTDSYKVSHWKQYPPKTQMIYSYLQSRGGEFEYSVFFGLQMILKKHFLSPISMDDINYAEVIFNKHFGNPTLFNREGWEYILNKHNGYLPIMIRAVPEGTTVPVGNVLMTIENTDDNVPWLTNYVETLLMQVWYPTTVCTQSQLMKQTILDFLEQTGTPSDIDYKLHDFGYRGSTSHESAGIGGLAHLVNFKGTDTFAAIEAAKDYYSEDMAGHSIPAAEHSTITSWGKFNEVEAYKNMLEQYPEGIVAVVSDSYDIYNACENIWGDLLKDQVLNRDGILVIRPDSGDPLKVIPVILEILAEKFGHYVNNKGYKVLNDKVRIIQGDGIGLKSLESILATMQTKTWSADNIAFGSGGALLQKVDRDTQKFAIKCSAAFIDGKWSDVYKSPVTDPGKSSLRGRLKLIKQNGMLQTVSVGLTNESDLLETVYLNGSLIKDQTLDEIRRNVS